MLLTAFSEGAWKPLAAAAVLSFQFLWYPNSLSQQKQFLFSQISFSASAAELITRARNTKNVILSLQRQCSFYLFSLTFPCCFLMTSPSAGPDPHDIHDLCPCFRTVCPPCFMYPPTLITLRAFHVHIHQMQVCLHTSKLCPNFQHRVFRINLGTLGLTVTDTIQEQFVRQDFRSKNKKWHIKFHSFVCHSTWTYHD